MAYNIIVKANVPADKFGFKNTDRCLYFYCRSLKDLHLTLRVITAPGYRVWKPATLSKYLRYFGGKLELYNPLLKTKMYSMFLIDIQPDISDSIEYTSRKGITHILKTMDKIKAEYIINDIYS